VSQRLVVAITGASGVILGIRLLEILKASSEVETHLILSHGARTTIASETDRSAEDVRALADVCYPESNVGASVASGSFSAMGMVVAPCSIKTLSSIANCYADNLISRAADVTLKEQRRLLLLVRETPLHRGHLRLMAQACESGATIMPPTPAFYHRPQTLESLVDQTVGRALDQFGFETEVVKRWTGVADALRANR
jgi:flavin prenyltransferase